MQFFHHSIFHTERYCKTVFQLAAFFCMCVLTFVILPCLSSNLQGPLVLLPVLCVVGSGWSGLLLFLWSIGYCDCGQNPGPMFLGKPSRVMMVLIASRIWLLSHLLAATFVARDIVFNNGTEHFVLAGIFLSMGLPFFVLVVSGWAEKFQGDISLVTSVDINATNLKERSQDDLEHLLALARDLDEEINATVISRYISRK